MRLVLNASSLSRSDVNFPLCPLSTRSAQFAVATSSPRTPSQLRANCICGDCYLLILTRSSIIRHPMYSALIPQSTWGGG
eukprot:NODE_19913_length_822_cov_4.305036.p6 GENE.NODE_19913_length_822_cov_4.305036~~NODE_19913_length_822_cov_4.305036.p6  ORF type:complete len:80 (-),score=14.46 NODE_19913_length_822_cov_4.305036:35-274(-)